MRKKLFYSLSVAALLASCTSDEMIAPSVDAGEAQLSKRPELGQVVLSEPATRIAITEGAFGVNFEDGDKIGACIVDQPNFSKEEKGNIDGWKNRIWQYNDYVNGVKRQKEDGSNNWKNFVEVNGNVKGFYDFVQFISTNYPFTKEGDKWFSPANMVEGNYFFYAPYSANHLTRQKMLAELPMTQNVSEVEGSMYDTKYMKQDAKVSSKAIEDFTKGAAPVLVGYKFLDKASSNKPSVKTYNLYAYPMFTIVNDFNGWIFDGANKAGTTIATQMNKATKTITIDKVEVYYDGLGTNPIFYKAPFDFEKVKTKMADNWDAANFTTGTSTIDVLNTSATTVGSSEYGAQSYTINDVDYMLNEPRLASARRTSFVHTNHMTFNVNKTLQNGEKYHFHAVMPAGNYGTGLKARIYATIDGNKYVMLTGCEVEAFDSNADDRNDKARLKTVSNTDYLLSDASTGGLDIQLVRGQHFPLVEYTINSDGTAKGTKSFAGSALTINLKNTQAFQLNERPTADPTYGFVNNTAFISYLEENVQRGLPLTEINNSVSMDNWSLGQFAFASGTQCCIDAQLIKDLYNQTITASNDQAYPKLTLKSNLPIKDDVEIINVNGQILTYKAVVDGKTYNYSIRYTEAFPSSTTISNGYNVLTSGTLNGTSASGKNAVVEIASGEVELKNTTGINLIYVNPGATLKVNVNCGVKVIVRDGGNINIVGGKLTNTNNYFKNAVIQNNVLAEINGNEIGTVRANFNSWPVANINANTKINEVSIACAETEIIDQAQINIFSNLRQVTMTLTGLNKITSNADVTTTNIKSITAPAGTQWYHDTKKITVTRASLGGNNKTQLNNIVAAGSVTIN